ncbi:sugar phosphate isomerase/epimerase [Paenibacillus psychroresistens]|uniref:Sugar phosphate isomerase/epimerase n=1 Tax=Paenibacillus psychroresistens TaxID=1778678 RepID=A0A6B8RM05_9BACL|nr:sugar phosphate isomerase/epimerase [Paenibacillus psychroresistens]QGQ96565.1 sugar phosphate isomerase/epimerase [Paenibacillus psychroresistens]
MISLGINSVLFKDFDFATAAQHIKLCGYDGVELSAIKGMCEHIELDRWREQAAAIKQIAADHQLKLLSMEVAELNETRLLLAFEAAAELGIPIVNVGPGGKSDVEEDLQFTIEKLTRMAKLAGEYGVTLCVKAHVGGSIYNTSTSLSAMESIADSSFGIDMDPSHIYRAGENPEQALPAVISRVKHIHIRDCSGRQAGPGSIDKQACGRGDIDLIGYCQVLADSGYDGPVCLEVIGANGHSLTEVSIVAAESYGYLNAVLRSSGAR